MNTRKVFILLNVGKMYDNMQPLSIINVKIFHWVVQTILLCISDFSGRIW